MATFEFCDIEGNALPDIPRINGEPDSPLIRVVVCDPGVCIDISVEHELRFIPVPPPPDIERLLIDTAPANDVHMATADVELDHVSGTAAARAEIAAFEARFPTPAPPAPVAPKPFRGPRAWAAEQADRMDQWRNRPGD